MPPACAEGKQASKSPGASLCFIPGSTGVLSSESGAGMGAQGDMGSFDATGLFTNDVRYPAPLGAAGIEHGGCGFAQPARPPQAALNPNAPSPFLLLRTYSTPFSIFLCLCCFSFSFFSVTYCSVLAESILLSLRAHTAGLEEAAWADGSSPRLSSISASLPGTTCLHPRSKAGGSASVAGSVPAAGISPIFSFNRTRGKNKPN